MSEEKKLMVISRENFGKRELVSVVPAETSMWYTLMYADLDKKSVEYEKLPIVAYGLYKYLDGRTPSESIAMVVDEDGKLVPVDEYRAEFALVHETIELRADSYPKPIQVEQLDDVEMAFSGGGGKRWELWKTSHAQNGELQRNKEALYSSKEEAVAELNKIAYTQSHYDLSTPERKLKLTYDGNEALVRVEFVHEGRPELNAVWEILQNTDDVFLGGDDD